MAQVGVVLENYCNAQRLAESFEPRSVDLSMHIGRCYWRVRNSTA